MKTPIALVTPAHVEILVLGEDATAVALAASNLSEENCKNSPLYLPLLEFSASGFYLSPFTFLPFSFLFL